MSLGTLFDGIESREFDGSLRIQSGFGPVLGVLKEDKTLRNLIVELQRSPEGQQETLHRLLELLKGDEHSQYMHRHDSALTGYLYALNAVDPKLSQQVIDTILWTPNLFWARRLAKHIREGAKTDSASITPTP